MSQTETCATVRGSSEHLGDSLTVDAYGLTNLRGRVRYHLDEDPKTLKVFPIPLHDSSGNTLHYDRLSISPDGRILAATHGSTLQWLSVETGEVLDTADRAHDGDITGIAWAPRAVLMGDKKALVLATASIDKKVKLWAAPPLNPS
ncbi:hypothetical protein U1Q18_036069 [Sarracenia purpurea var. burkii]